MGSGKPLAGLRQPSPAPALRAGTSLERMHIVDGTGTRKADSPEMAHLPAGQFAPSYSADSV